MKTTILFLFATLAVSAQTSNSHQPEWCGFRPPERLAPKADVLEPNQYAIPRGDLCEMYTYERGWEETMVLQLGEGAEQYRQQIQRAAFLWNTTSATRYGTPGSLIRISDERPSDFRLPSSFWEREVDNWQSDGENVIYFKPSNDASAARGTAWNFYQTYDRDRVTESDVFINTRMEEEYGADQMWTTRVYSHDHEYGVYVYTDRIYTLLIHELGHALGLSHIPVKGNWMSYSLNPNLKEQWEAPAALYANLILSYLGGEEALKNDFFVDHIENTFPRTPQNERQRILMRFYSSLVRLGDMDKMMLACIYEF